MAEKNLEKDVNEQSDADPIWSMSGIIVYKKKLHLVSVCTTDLILDLPSWARDLALGQRELAGSASTPDFKRMFETNAKTLHRWAEGDVDKKPESRDLFVAAPFLAARAAHGYREVHASNILTFTEDVMRRAVPAKKGDTLAFIFIADTEAAEIHAIDAKNYLVHYAAPGIEAQIWSQTDFDSLCLAAIRKFPSVSVSADAPDLSPLTTEDIFNRSILQGIMSGVMPAGVQVEARERPTTSKPKRIPKKRQ